MNESDICQLDWFPVRAMDFNPNNNCLYTGDEMGYINKWDCTELLKKLEMVKRTEKKTAAPAEMAGMMGKRPEMLKKESTFVTGVDTGE